MRTITLDGPANLPALMARAAASARGRGGQLPDVEVRRLGAGVDLAHLAAYDRACGFPLRNTPPAPYLHVLSFGLQLTLMAERSFPLALPGLVHVANRLELLRPVGVGECIDLSVRAERLRAHPRGRQVDLVGVAAVAGEVVWRGCSTYLAKGSASGHGSASGVGRGTGEDRLQVSVAVDGPPRTRWRLPADLGRQYARVSGDVNPIHLNPLAARLFGFPRAIAHGMWSLARCLAAVEAWSPPAAVSEMEFRRPILLPSTVELRTRPVGGGWDLQLAAPAQGDRRAAQYLSGRIRPPC